ncbi:CLUMA_CG011132, isoform A [Clunio marinus]|uniref:CLUMA_CG011132, isoform A n=1 Tax=Clunio marinus TaxID=568069 RepID=A0A1J1IBZ3_9DIPT|nr:CLUMA_CG011132, isoform A [Clunio marinus]
MSINYIHIKVPRHIFSAHDCHHAKQFLHKLLCNLNQIEAEDVLLLLFNISQSANNMKRIKL